MSPALQEALEVLKTTAGNIRSLGPAGALDYVYEPYRNWLKAVDDAVAAIEAEQNDPRPTP